jgi:hypothetical protein
MLPPYTTEEIARAVLARCEHGREPVRRVIVTADVRTREWRISAELSTGESRTARYGFSAAEGIHTPAELAHWFGRDAGLA